MSTPDDDKLNINKTFRLSKAMEKFIDDRAAEIGTSASDLVRRSIELSSGLIADHPVVLSFDRQELQNLASCISKAIAIHPASVSIRGDKGPE